VFVIAWLSNYFFEKPTNLAIRWLLVPRAPKAQTVPIELLKSSTAATSGSRAAIRQVAIEAKGQYAHSRKVCASVRAPFCEQAVGRANLARAKANRSGNMGPAGTSS